MKKYSLHIGVWSPTKCETAQTLEGPKTDPDVMQALAVEAGFTPLRPPLLGDYANSQTVLDQIAIAAALLKESGGTFLITFSGHGVSRSPTQTWCLSNRQVDENELLTALSAFGENAKVIVVSGSCHSGGLAPRSFIEKIIDFLGRLMGLSSPKDELFRRPTAAPPPALPDPVRINTNVSISASVLYLASCAENQDARDGKLTLFTEIIQQVWIDPNSPATFREFMGKVAGEVYNRNGAQTPVVGAAGPDPDWYRTGNPFDRP